MSASDDKNDDLVRATKERVVELFSKELTSAERVWLSDACVRRYLRARKCDKEKAAEMCSATLQWQRDYRPAVHETDRQALVKEATSCKMYVPGTRDKQGRPIVMMRPVRDDTGDEAADEKVRYLSFVMEQAIEMIDESADADGDAGKMTWVVDMTGMRVAMSHSMSITKRCISMLEAHYPERLGHAFFLNPPWLFHGLFRIVSPFIDPATRSKATMLKKSQFDQMYEHIDLDQLETDLGGELPPYAFDQDTFLATTSSSSAGSGNDKSASSSSSSSSSSASDEE
jgi:phosphatidylinositol/phosphatidylcholine transfer protein